MLKNDNPKTGWTAGESCWLYDAATDSVHSAVIVRAYKTNDRVKLHDPSACRTYHMPADCLFERHDQAMTAMLAYHDGVYAGYIEEMPTLEAAMAFPLRHDVSRGEHADHLARAAYVDRINQLTGAGLKS